jgi:methylaspartate mutase epsilon subunit
LELGDGDPLRGELRAVEAGVLDIPFPAWVHVKGKVLPVRDANGAMRYLDHGNLPFTQEIVRYHREKIRQRERTDGIKADMKMVADDITYLSKEN